MSDEGQNAFRIEVEDDLIAAALAAVERLEKKRLLPDREPERAPEPSPEPAPEPAPEIDLPIPGDEPPAFDAGAWGEPPPSAVDAANARADEAQRALESIRAEMVEVKERLLRSAAANRQLRDRLETLRLQLNDAEATSAGREKALGELRAAAQSQESERVKSRQRQARELEEARRFGVEPLVRELLPAVDNMDLALTHHQGEGDISAEGLRIILAQVHRALAKVGVERVEGGRGTPFDPTLHEAIQSVADDEVAPGQIIETHQPGYRLHGRLLRAARVAVSRGGAPKEPPGEE